jgi:SAM-dependent methyltransferase
MSEFEELKLLLKQDNWPKAIPDPLICDVDSEEDKNLRAGEILSFMVNEPLKDKKVLDYGCGEGHLARQAAANSASLSIGYDITAQGNFKWEEQEDNCLLTTDFSKIENELFDVVVIYDVLDHSIEEEPSSVIKKAIDLTTKGGVIHIRCHPWCSRHGGHLYQQINKAFIHLIFSEEELKELGYTIEPIRKVTRPLMAYTGWFQNAGIEDIKPLGDYKDPEKFFSNNGLVLKRLQKAVELDKFPRYQLRQSFLDYVVKVV